MKKKWLFALITTTTLLLCILRPGQVSAQDWAPIEKAAPPGLLQQFQKDYASEFPSDWHGETGRALLLTIQQHGSIPLYLIDTSGVYPPGHPEQTPTCGTDGCLFLGYIPKGNGYQQVLNGNINDFQVQGQPPVIQPLERETYNIPCLQLNTYNQQAQAMDSSVTICFDGTRFAPSGEQH